MIWPNLRLFLIANLFLLLVAYVLLDAKRIFVKRKLWYRLPENDLDSISDEREEEEEEQEELM